jgi:RimJ/RimL family protein N-acetyltransferase
VGELLVREPTAADVPAVAPAFLDPSVGGEAGLPPLPEPAILAFLERDLPQLRAIGYTLPLVIADADASIVGGATLNRHDPLRSRVEVGYWLYPAARGRGIATRVVRALAQHAFSVGLVRVDALIRPANTASIRVVERAGFAREGLLRAGLRHGEGWTDALLYAAVSAG